jgi:hypothetical protein
VGEPVEASASSPGRPPGLLVITGIFALGAVASLGLIAVGTPTGAAVGAVGATVNLLVVLGLWRGSEAARRLVVGLLVLAMIADVGLLGWLGAGLAGLLELPPNAQPARRASSAVFRLSLTWWMVSYLRGEVVLAWFQERSGSSRHTTKAPSTRA